MILKDSDRWWREVRVAPFISCLAFIAASATVLLVLVLFTTSTIRAESFSTDWWERKRFSRAIMAERSVAEMERSRRSVRKREAEWRERDKRWALLSAAGSPRSDKILTNIPGPCNSWPTNSSMNRNNYFNISWKLLPSPDFIHSLFSVRGGVLDTHIQTNRQNEIQTSLNKDIAAEEN